ncbi:cation:proton antiporter domain-containing protein [Catellatospora coxensis]|uniref:cation:proton antiporter domain-containing protein n=1 Tax=Catellatospora coxensis TaxID=310354 RepID=UPI001944AA45|nr:cation:proton antiporter [Catellatospora coxensis]
MVRVYGLIALAVVLIAWAAVSARAARYSVTLPIALLLAGLLVAGGDDPMVEVDVSSAAVQHVLQLTLALILFTDATEISLRRLWSAGHLPLRLLLVAFPLTVLAGLVAGLALFPQANVWVIAMVAAALTATDASLATMLVRDERIPHDLRTAVTVESGLNDGLAAPLVVFFAAAAAAAGTERGPGSVLGHTVVELLIALVAGVAAGGGAGLLLRWARRRGWSAAKAERLAYLAVGVLVFETTHVLHGNGIVAAFVAGLAVRAVDRDLPERHLQTSHDVVALLAAGVWFAFGSLIPHTLADLVNWRVLLYAVLSLTAVRMLPVALSLVGLRRYPREVWLLSWLGPRGLPSVIFALIGVQQLTGASAQLAISLIMATVLLSVLAHGLSAIPIADSWSVAPAPARPPHT